MHTTKLRKPSLSWRSPKFFLVAGLSLAACASENESNDNLDNESSSKDSDPSDHDSGNSGDEGESESSNESSVGTDEEGGFGKPTVEEIADLAEGYADLVFDSYVDSLAKAKEMQSAIGDLVSGPSEETLEAAKEAWLAARDPYGQTEGYRFYGGPIDNEERGPEGQLNAWPMDEAYLDYVDGMPDAGIINDPDGFPNINPEVLAGLNEEGGETNISTGYHAIEFLLWGQDMDDAGPGDRSFTDYVIGEGGTASNQDRRGEAINAVAQLLVEDLEMLVEAWQPNTANYRREFVEEPPEEILRRILIGMGSLGGAELAGERMEVAWDTRLQEDEHSCFSDNTHRDIHLNALSVQNIYLGDYGETEYAGVYDLVAARNAELADRTKEEIQASMDAIAEISAPFDQAIVDDDSRIKIRAAIDALRVQTDSIVEIAEEFEIVLNIE